MSDKHIIYVGIIFAFLIIAVVFFIKFPDHIELKPQPVGIDMSNDAVYPNESMTLSEENNTSNLKPIDMRNDVVTPSNSDYKPEVQSPTFDIRLENMDNIKHKVAFQVLDTNNNVIFNSTRSMKRDITTDYLNITSLKGEYVVNVIVDENITGTKRVKYYNGQVLVITIIPDDVEFSYATNWIQN